MTAKIISVNVAMLAQGSNATDELRAEGFYVLEVSEGPAFTVHNGDEPLRALRTRVAATLLASIVGVTVKAPAEVMCKDAVTLTDCLLAELEITKNQVRQRQ